MKTKHLFLATALVASFASCTNDDIVEVQQGLLSAERPTVDNVQINFGGDGVDSRLTYNGDYAWEATDVIGALLMDQPTGTVTEVWKNKYNLTKYVNTSYPFTYNPETKVWSNDAKMLEGNYFFAYPWSNYNGAREVVHSLKNQVQTGVSSSVVAESFADNQFLVGYSRIFGGTEAKDALKDVEMAAILGGVQLRIINGGSKTYHINKITIEGTQVASAVQLDPQGFNYANYVGDKSANSGYQASVVEVANFKRSDLIRAQVAKVGTGAGVAQLKVKGEAAERAIAQGATGYALIMLNQMTLSSSDALKLSIYTDEGVVKNIDLTTVNTTVASKPLVDKKVEKVAHNKSNTVVVKFDDDDLQSIQGNDIVDEEDLMQLLEWNANSELKVTATATLLDDVVLTNEMFELLQSNKNVTLAITGAYELTLAKELPADVLEYAGLSINSNVDVVVAGEIDLTEDTKQIVDMIVAKGAVVNVDDAKATLPSAIHNDGTINFGANAIASVALTNDETGIVNVAKGADVKGNTNAVFLNSGKINNNGYVEHITNNADAVITLGENATLKDLVNNADATVNTAKGVQVVGTNAGLINYVTGATLNVTGAGMVSAEAPASIAKNAYKDTGINTLTLKPGAITTFADATTGGITTVITTEGSTLKVADKVALSLTNLYVKGNTTIITNTTSGENASSLTASKIVISKGVELTNNGTFTVSTSWTNNGVVFNNGAAYLYNGATKGTFKYTAPVIGEATTPAAQIDALELAVAEYINNPLSSYTVTDAYSVVEASFETHLSYCPSNAGANPKGAAYVAAYGATVKTEDLSAALSSVLTDYKDELVTALKTATFGKLNTDFDNDAATVTNGKTAKAKAIAAFKDAIIEHTNEIVSGTFTYEVYRAAAAKLTDDEVMAYIDNNKIFVYDGCNLQKAIAVWQKYQQLDINAYEYNDMTWTGTSTDTLNAAFESWAKEMLTSSSYSTIATELNTAGVTLATVVSFGDYTDAQFRLCNTENQE